MEHGNELTRLRELTRVFWVRVNGRLVNVHRVPATTAKRAVLIYRKRVGDAALNRGERETARDIATVVRGGGFKTIQAVKVGTTASTAAKKLARATAR